MKCSIFTEKPDFFHPTVEGAGCYCEWGDKILFVKRHPDKPYGHTWGIPGGKMDPGETPRMTAIREVLEEVGIDIDSENLQELGPLYCRIPDLDYIFHVFRIRLHEQPHIILNEDEHLEMRWVTYQEAFDLPLIVGGPEALQLYHEKWHRHN